MRFRLYAPVAESEQQVEKKKETKSPNRASIGSDVAVPFLQTVLSGVFGGSLLVFIISEAVPSWNVNLFKVWLLSSLAIAAIVWVLLLIDTRWPYSTVLWIVEEIFGDVNKDGKTEARPVFINRKQTTTTARNKYLEDFHSWVRSLSIKGTTWEAHQPTMRRRKYEGFRDALLQGGWARWKDPEVHTLGWELTEDPETVIENLNE